MASINEKIKHSSVFRVNLYKEGVFWLAYEQSAYYVWLLKGYKPTKKRYKKMNKEVVQIGFSKVDALLENQNISAVTRQDAFISFNTIIPIEISKFEIWKNNLTSAAVAAKPTAINKNIQQEIIESISFFDCINKTPVEAMLFINELKIRINYGNL
ncbi:hypothetical protein [Polaribacter glomeratus]|uniref:Uncharacterized protein n=1 Tax=Polaribacter glomeratus TaxID=102 RepID=A0A2S7WWI4_9FLAO|nr:hypothetical protein [Polaribacter glomeratus]PQJ81928.1 hypothetical protein BTO16_04785 [Polaribacter glomeratus]TXD64417.1 hypothetical protein ESX12_14955 [Polaribacter glomeratus]